MRVEVAANRGLTERDAWHDLCTDLAEIEAATFADYTAGEHCQWRPHRSLPCSDEAIE
jgi:hypothetical protein